jgi:hypothetical protein
MRLVIIAVILMQSCQATMIYDAQIGEYRNMSLRVDNEGNVSGFDYDRSVPLEGQIDEDGRGYVQPLGRYDSQINVKLRDNDYEYDW